MFFSATRPDWRPGLPLSPAGSLLFRTQAEARAFLPEGQVVTVSVCFDARTRRVLGNRPHFSQPAWSAHALENALGGVTVFEPLPPAFIQPISPGDPRLGEPPTTLAFPDFGGWDSLTMALLA
jgi:hypothetical protein